MTLIVINNQPGQNLCAERSSDMHDTLSITISLNTLYKKRERECGGDICHRGSKGVVGVI